MLLLPPLLRLWGILMNLMRLGAFSNKADRHRRLPGPRSFVVRALLMGLLVLMTGCGEEQGQVQEADTLTVVASGSSYLAVQDGLGDWQRLSDSPAPQNISTVTLSDPQGRYGVMSVCLDEGGGAVSVQVRRGILASAQVVAGEQNGAALVRAGTSRGAALERLSCGDAATPETQGVVRAQVHGLFDGEYGSVYLGNASALVDASTTLTNLGALGTDPFDLVATRYAPDARLPDALLLRTGLEPTAAGVTLDFASPDTVRLEAALIPLAGARPGELLSGSVELLTASGTRALLGEATAINGLSYARPPAALLRDAALYAEAQSFLYNDRTKAGSSRSVSRAFVGGVITPLELPPPLHLGAPVITGSDDALRPRARWTAADVNSGSYTQFYSQAREGKSVSYRFSQSLGYLRVRFPDAATYTQTLPDFRALPGWSAAWNLLPGDDLFWDVSYNRSTETESASSSRSGVIAAP